MHNMYTSTTYTETVPKAKPKQVMDQAMATMVTMNTAVKQGTLVPCKEQVSIYE